MSSLHATSLHANNRRQKKHKFLHAVFFTFQTMKPYILISTSSQLLIFEGKLFKRFSYARGQLFKGRLTFAKI